MSNIGIIYSNTSCIDQKIKDFKNGEMLKLHSFLGEEEFFGDSKELMIAAKEKNIIPTTSQPSTIEIKELIEESLTKYDDIIIFSPSQYLSGTYSNTILAIGMLKTNKNRIHIVKVRSYSLSEYAMITRGIDMINSEKYKIEDIVDTLNENAKHFETFIVPGTLDYLKKSGRVNLSQLIIGKLINFKLLLRHVEPVPNIYKKVRSSKKILQEIEAELINKKTKRIYFTSYQDDDKVEKYLRKIANENNVEFIDCEVVPIIIACHFGPKSFGISLERENIPDDFKGE